MSTAIPPPSIPVPVLPSDKAPNSDTPSLPVVDSEEKNTDPSEHVPDVLVHPLAQLSQAKKNFLLFIFSVATFVDICSISGVGLALGQIRADLGLQINQTAWILTSYSLTFGGFILLARRLADLFPATIIFEIGFTSLGVISLITSFVTTNKYAFLILRGLAGLAGSMTIPSSYNMAVYMFPNADEQQRKLSLLGMAGGVGNCVGLIIAGLSMLASYHWFFRILGGIALMFSAAAIYLLPHSAAAASSNPDPKWKRLDNPGVILVIAFLICFILALTNGPIEGWASANFIAPLIISFASLAGFFVWEWSIPAETAMLPTSVYKIKNFGVSSLIIFVPVGFWNSSQPYFATWFQTAYGWSPTAAVLPQCIIGLAIGVATQYFPQIIGKPRKFVPTGVIFVIIGTILQIYSYGGEGLNYWRYLFPAFLLGSGGAMFVYFASVIPLIMYAPPEMSGVVSGVVQVMSQIGGSIALAVQSAFQTADEDDWMRSAGRGYWFLVAWSAVLGLVYIVLWRKPGSPAEEHELARARIRASGKGAGAVPDA